MLAPQSAYVHLPWCIRKCPYCDFNSHPLKPEHDLDRYIGSLSQDWQAQRERLHIEQQFHTIFFGGGTPSLFTPEQLSQVLELLSVDPDAEVTMEANPGTTEHADFSDYRAAGINRLSLGAQTFSDAKLKSIGRIHQAEDTIKAFDLARLGGFDNINLDLMWGLPEQTVAEALSDLTQAIELNSEHISWYQLTLEPKTEFFRRQPLLPVDQTLADIERLGLALLKDYGYERYEVSAYARSGRYSQHNLNYWSFGDYLGLGAGAHGKWSNSETSKLSVVRTFKPSQPRLYMESPRQTTHDPVSLNDLPLEFMMNALRLVDGVSKASFTERTGLAWDVVRQRWERLHDRGLVQLDRCATTPMGLRYLDSVLAEFV